MDIQIEDIDSCNKKITFDIPHQDYQEKVRNYYKTLSRQVKIPGFRKGKVPQSILEKQFGPEVKREVLSQLIQEGVSHAIQEKGLQAVSPPHLLEVQAEEGTDIHVSARVEVLPEFEVQTIDDLEVTMKVPEVTDEEVDQVVETFRERAGKNVQVTDRPAQKDDLLKIDFKGTLEGKPFEGGEAQDYVIQLGQGHLIEDFDKVFYGMQPGEEKDVRVAIPENYFNKTIAGKEVDFHIRLKGIQVKDLPERNDEFARTFDPEKKYENLEDMKRKIRQDLEDYERTQARKGARKELADKLVEANPLNVPEGLIQEQIKFMIEQEKRKTGSSQAGAPTGEESGAEPSPQETERLRPQAVKILQQELLVDQLARDLNIEVTPQELEQELNHFIQLLGGGDPEKMKKEWQQSGVLARLQSRMRREKTLNTLLDRVRLREETVDRNQLIQDN